MDSMFLHREADGRDVKTDTCACSLMQDKVKHTQP